MAFTVSIQDEVTPALQALKKALAPAELNRIMGRAVSNLVRDHLVKRDASHANALVGKRTHFYGRAAKATFHTATASQATVTVAWLGMRQRLEGGPIVPRNAKLLTIPAIAEAYGRRAREFNNLVLRWVKNERDKMQPALVEADATKIRVTKKKGVKNLGSVGGRVFYWLARQVTQKGDPTVLPSSQAMAQAAVDAASRAIDRALASSGTKTA